MKYIVTNNKFAEGQGPDGDYALNSAQIAKTGSTYVDAEGKTRNLPDKPIGWLNTGEDLLPIGTIITRPDSDPYRRMPWAKKDGQLIHLAVDKAERKERKAVLAAGGYDAQKEQTLAKLQFDNVVPAIKGS